jgi:hypothetical protein
MNQITTFAQTTRPSLVMKRFSMAGELTSPASTRSNVSRLAVRSSGWVRAKNPVSRSSASVYPTISQNAGLTATNRPSRFAMTIPMFAPANKSRNVGSLTRSCAPEAPSTAKP